MALYFFNKPIVNVLYDKLSCDSYNRNFMPLDTIFRLQISQIQHNYKKPGEPIILPPVNNLYISWITSHEAYLELSFNDHNNKLNMEQLKKM